MIIKTKRQLFNDKNNETNDGFVTDLKLHIVKLTESFKITFSLLTLAVFDHADTYGQISWAFEIFACEMSEFTPLQLRFVLHKARKNYI